VISGKGEILDTSAHEIVSEQGKKEEKVVITGDDILIEYVKRLIKVIKKYSQGKYGSHMAQGINVGLQRKVE